MSILQMSNPGPSDTAMFTHAPLQRMPSGYTWTQCSSINSTVSSIRGPGRIVGHILSSAGASAQRLIDRVAERFGQGPHMAARRITSELHRTHVAGRTRSRPACQNEYSKDVMNIVDIAYRLLWVCNGTCSQCSAPYLPLSFESIPSTLQKSIEQLLCYLRCVIISYVRAHTNTHSYLLYSAMRRLRCSILNWL
jgi:hypothetical protein